MTIQPHGRIIKAERGIYYIEVNSSYNNPRHVIECRGRGILRKDGITPYVGDIADISLNGDGTGTITGIRPRKNTLTRPPLANLDYMVAVLSVIEPAPNLYVADKFIAILEHKDIEPCVAITKSDISGAEEIASVYRHAGYPVFIVSGVTGEGVKEIKDFLAGKLCAFSGNSGVGKSSLLNVINPSFAIEVGDISKKLGRGRHTTRHVELYALDNGALIADTPGFSSIEIVQSSDIGKESLPYCFRDFEPYLGSCRFADCSHTKEAGCAILEAVQNGEIQASRHKSYLMMYNDVKDLKEWEK